MECPIAWTSRVHMNSQEGGLDPRGPCTRAVRVGFHRGPWGEKVKSASRIQVKPGPAEGACAGREGKPCQCPHCRPRDWNQPPWAAPGHAHQLFDPVNRLPSASTLSEPVCRPSLWSK